MGLLKIGADLASAEQKETGGDGRQQENPSYG